MFVEQMDQSMTNTDSATNSLLSKVQLQSKFVNRSWFEDVEEFEAEIMEVSGN